MTTPAVQRAVDAAFREEWGRVVATLIRRTGNWDLAEECAQEASPKRCGAGRPTASRTAPVPG
jgi:predicted RNA polymerase sigma factor